MTAKRTSQPARHFARATTTIPVLVHQQAHKRPKLPPRNQVSSQYCSYVQREDKIQKKVVSHETGFDVHLHEKRKGSRGKLLIPLLVRPLDIVFSVPAVITSTPSPRERYTSTSVQLFSPTCILL